MNLAAAYFGRAGFDIFNVIKRLDGGDNGGPVAGLAAWAAAATA